MASGGCRRKPWTRLGNTSGWNWSPSGRPVAAGGLSTECAESSYGVPVVVVDGEDFARGTGEVHIIRRTDTTDLKLFKRAWDAGFEPDVDPDYK